MGTIAKGMITLSSLNDAFTVSLSPNSCVIRADYNGANPQLTNAYTHVKVSRGTVATQFSMTIQSISNNNIQYTVSQVDTYTKAIRLTQIPSDIISGSLEFVVSVGNEFSTLISFQFTVVRESTMLDWIQDWETNKTTIGSTYLITPKIFVGSRITTSADMNSLTGVYIGPDSTNGAGIYGLQAGNEIFHINENGGSIGGWSIETGGIQTSDGKLRILSEGSIIAQDANANLLWAIYKSGEASFAAGNVQFHSDGSASFAGTITASAGSIGGWTINTGILYSSNILLSSANNYIGISAASTPTSTYLTHRSGIVDSGGVFLSYLTANSYGIFGYLPKDANNNTRMTFAVGSTNQIAGWNFDNEAIWLGTKLNQLANYAAANSITIGTNGLRGTNWYIDTTGAVSFLGGLVSFGTSGGSLVGWTIREERLSTDYAAIISNASNAGIFLSKYNIANIATASLVTTIQGNGGIYMRRTGSDVELVGYKGTTKVFQLSSTNDSQIAAWYFNNTALYMGTLTTSGFTGQSGHITIGNTGLRGYKWRLESDGSGALAGGNITWGADGSVSISVVNTLKSNLASTGINVDTGIITITADKTQFVNPDGVQIASFTEDGLQSNKVQCLDAEGNKRLEVDVNGVRMYYPLQSGQVTPQVMKEEIFTFDGSGNITGTETRYYNLNGTIKWILDSAGSLSTSQLQEYWTTNAAYIVDETSMQQIFTAAKNQHGLSYAFTNTTGRPASGVGSISRFTSINGSHSGYNGLTANGAIANSTAPSSSTDWLTGWLMTNMNATYEGKEDSLKEGIYSRHFVYYNDGEPSTCILQWNGNSYLVQELTIEFSRDLQCVTDILYEETTPTI